jgi:hypothetical protein
MKVYIYKNADNAKQFAKENGNTVAVEAEYGEQSLEMGDEGVIYEMNHHGLKQHFSAPCNRFEEYGNYKDSNFIVSHLDLDSVMGIGIVCGIIDDKNRDFAKHAEFVDVFGLHRLKELGNKFREEMDNFQAFLQPLNRSFQEGEDVTQIVINSNLKLKDILENGYNLIEVENFNKEKEKSIQNFEIKELSNDKIRIFETQGQSLIFEYDTRNIIVQLNNKFNAITLAVYNEEIAIKTFGETGVIIPLKKFFGEKAGGKTTIGGGDRNVKATKEDLIKFVDFLKNNYNLN